MSSDDLFFSEDHTWVRIEEMGAEIGITDYAQEELGDITFIELPSVGVQVEHHEELGVVESTKAASPVYCPISGTIAAVNTALEDMPEAINRDPYGDGWICRLKGYDIKEIKALMTVEKYEKFLAQQ